MSDAPALRGTTAQDPFAAFKAAQRLGGSHFGPFALFTVPPAGRLVCFAGIRAGQDVLDVGCGTGVVAITAALQGAKVVGSDLTPELLEQARHNAEIAHTDVKWREADVEALPFDDAAYDVVVSQFGHMLAPRAAVAIAGMLRVLRPGGTLAFSTWPPDAFVERWVRKLATQSRESPRVTARASAMSLDRPERSPSSVHSRPRRLTRRASRCLRTFGRRVAPVFRVGLPVRREVGWSRRGSLPKKALQFASCALVIDAGEREGRPQNA